MTVNFKLLSQTAKPPRYASEGAACFDLALDAPEPIALYPKNLVVVGTGLAFEVPRGHAMHVHVRSSMGFRHGIVLANGTGIIDSDYRGELKLALINHGPALVTLSPGERIAQAQIVPALQWALVEVPELSETARGAGGFGSTGAH